MRTGRTTAVLERFPLHVAATDPGKHFESVVGSIGSLLDVQARQIGNVRRAHRLAEAPTDHDLLALLALHSIGPAAFACSTLRIDALAATPPDDLPQLAAHLGIESVQLGDIDQEALTTALDRLIRFSGRLTMRRRSSAGMIRSFREGNATPAALLLAAAAYLALDVVEIAHSEERWWHLARCSEMLDLGIDSVDTGDALLAVEENPFTEADVSPIDRRHADRFRIVRGGLEDVVVTTDVVGIGSRTLWPMVVNVDEGRGVVFAGAVPHGVTLSFAVSGKVTLDGAEVTGSSFAFDGAVFADADAEHPNDYVYTGEDAPQDRDAVFVVTMPVTAAFGESVSLPHPGATVEPLPMSLGESRWAFFVRVAHFGSHPRPAVASYAAGRFDQSVWADPDGLLDYVSGSVGFRWQEREPFAVRMLLPERFAALDDDDGTRLREPLRRLLDRHRAAGVHMYVAYADDRWVLGTGIVRDVDSHDVLGTLVSGTTLWPTTDE